MEKTCEEEKLPPTLEFSEGYFIFLSESLEDAILLDKKRRDAIMGCKLELLEIKKRLNLGLVELLEKKENAFGFKPAFFERLKSELSVLFCWGVVEETEDLIPQFIELYSIFSSNNPQPEINLNETTAFLPEGKLQKHIFSRCEARKKLARIDQRYYGLLRKMAEDEKRLGAAGNLLEGIKLRLFKKTEKEETEKDGVRQAFENDKEKIRKKRHWQALAESGSRSIEPKRRISGLLEFARNEIMLSEIYSDMLEIKKNAENETEALASIAQKMKRHILGKPTADISDALLILDISRRINPEEAIFAEKFVSDPSTRKRLMQKSEEMLHERKKALKREINSFDRIEAEINVLLAEGLIKTPNFFETVIGIAEDKWLEGNEEMRQIYTEEAMGEITLRILKKWNCCI